jgi:opacity protein-like surface antigen
VVRSAVGAAVALVLLTANVADAQPAVFSGLLTGHIGAVAGGDVRDWTVAPGASMTVIDESGLGVEVDVGHAGDFDSEQFHDSSITSVMVNFTTVYPQERFRPFLIVGAGILRLRAALQPNAASISHTDTGWNAGGGALYMMNEALGFRADVRYFRNFGRQDAFPLGNNGVLDFVRSSFGVTYVWPMR